MLVRNEVEDEYRKLFEKYNFGIAAYSALEGGLLTGKYLNAEENVEGSRFSEKPEKLGNFPGHILKFLHQEKIDQEKLKKSLLELSKLAEG